MRSVTRQITVYIAADGKEFTDKEECQEYEKTAQVNILRMSDAKYFELHYTPVDGKGYTKILYICADITALALDAKSVVQNFAYIYFGNPVITVNGQIVDGWHLFESTLEHYKNALRNHKSMRDARYEEVGALFITNRGALEGYPAPMLVEETMSHSVSKFESVVRRKPISKPV